MATEEATAGEPETPVKKEYTCRHCGDTTGHSRQARFAHEKTCPLNPKNKPVEPDGDIDKNREEYEKTTGLDIPTTDEPLAELAAEPTEDFTFDPLIALAGLVILLIVGAIIMRDRIIAVFKGKPPQQGRGYMA